MDTQEKTKIFVLDMCDRLCLNHDLYVEFNNYPEKVVERYKDRDVDTSTMLDAINAKLNVQTLKSHWENAIMCACRDIAIIIPD